MTSARFLPAGFTASLLLAAGAVAPLPPARAQAWPIGVAPYQRQPWGYAPSPNQRPVNPWAYGDMVSDGNDALPPPPAAQGPYGPAPGAPGPYATQPLTPAQLAQRCNTGRLVGGLLGGGLGYGLSRQDGRAWAVPLGALLGSQMGCSAAVGNGPRPW
mgnify:CR=1 FL=1